MAARKKYIASDLEKLDRLSDDDIDFSDIPELDEDALVEVKLNPTKDQDELTLHIDHEVVEYFKHQGQNYEAMMNHVLRAYVNAVQRNK
jgi:uncharacterized protein (DUF4415 family)